MYSNNWIKHEFWFSTWMQLKKKNWERERGRDIMKANRGKIHAIEKEGKEVMRISGFVNFWSNYFVTFLWVSIISCNFFFHSSWSCNHVYSILMAIHSFPSQVIRIYLWFLIFQKKKVEQNCQKPWKKTRLKCWIFFYLYGRKYLLLQHSQFLQNYTH